MKRDNWFQTSTGRIFPLPDFKPSDFAIEDIAHALSLTCRFNGHCLTFYSVAQHSEIVSRLVPAEFAMWGLLHDASEAFLSDVVAPFKDMLPQYKELEKRVMRAITIRFGLPEQQPACVREADLIALATEKRDLLVPEAKPWESLEGVEPRASKIEPWSWAIAEQRFLKRFKELEER